jgi:3-hydroxyisobutyrate dehydrogenase-like beta-hydroxyacid dehydrogenase
VHDLARLLVPDRVVAGALAGGERAVEALLASVVASPMLAYRGPLVLGHPDEAWFDCRMMQKDLDLALELGRDLPGVERSGETLVEDLDTLEAATDEGRLQAGADALDLGELGHSRPG